MLIQSAVLIFLKHFFPKNDHIEEWFEAYNKRCEHGLKMGKVRVKPGKLAWSEKRWLWGYKWWARDIMGCCFILCTSNWLIQWIGSTKFNCPTSFFLNRAAGHYHWREAWKNQIDWCRVEGKTDPWRVQCLQKTWNREGKGR